MPTKSVPGGCVVGLIGVASCTYATLCGVVLFLIWQKEQITRRQELFETLTWHAVVAAILGLVLLCFGWRLAMRTGAYEHWDRNQPRMKF